MGMRSGLKMAGAKGPEMMAQILPRLPPAEGPWMIPFFGIGSAARALHESGREIAYASDASPALVALLQALRLRPDHLLAVAEAHAKDVVALETAEEQREWYFASRDTLNTVGAHEAPALFLVVWRLAYNGLARFSRVGRFNAPSRIQPGKPVRKVLDVEALRAFSGWLRTIPRVELAGYEETPAGPAYLDPPYVGTHDTYVAGGFDHDAFHAWLAERAGPWAASNSAAAIGAYTAAYLHREIHEVQRSGRISRDGKGRGPVPEILAICR